MNFGQTLLTIFEVALAAGVIWAVFHEDVFVDFEDRIIARFRRRRFKVIDGGSNVAKSYYPSQKNA
ncbi:MAG: hypothetical protein Q4B40_06955 [Clostridia bacterium]|nr:hypothetical protein [Clostridia bacterium]